MRRLSRTALVIASLATIALAAPAIIATPAAASPVMICDNSTVSINGSDVFLEGCHISSSEDDQNITIYMENVTNLGSSPVSLTFDVIIDDERYNRTTLELGPGETREFQIDIFVNATGERNVSVTYLELGNITLYEHVPWYDTNDNGRADLDEVQRAIEIWAEGKTTPRGTHIGLTRLQQIIDIWARGGVAA